MSRHYYNPVTGGFLLAGVNTIPAEAIALTDAEFDALFAAQAAGREIRPGPDGNPVAVQHTQTDADLLNQIRDRRDRLLADCDFTQLPDSPLTEAQRAAWAGYRAALRNLPETCADAPAAVIWPQPPA